MPNLLTNVAMGVLTHLGISAVKNSGPVIAEPVEPEPDSEESTSIGNAIMSFDIVGEDLFDDDDYDDIAGAIGEDDDDDEDLIEMLAVSGLGDSEIVGDDDDLLIGARRRRVRSTGKSRRSRKARAIKKLAMRGAAGVVSRGLDKRRRYPLGFVPTTITTGTTSSIPSSPQNLYRAERLVIPSDIAFDIGVTDIKVGNQSQFVQNVEVPAAIFSEVAIDTAVHFDTAEVGNQVSVSARNKSANSVEFTAALIGTAAK